MTILADSTRFERSDDLAGHEPATENETPEQALRPYSSPELIDFDGITTLTGDQTIIWS